MRIAVALRDRLPRVAALYGRGEISSRLVSEITWRTQLVDDEELAPLIDAALADAVVEWGPLSEAKLITEIDSIIERFDPGGGAAHQGVDEVPRFPDRGTR